MAKLRKIYPTFLKVLIIVFIAGYFAAFTTRNPGMSSAREACKEFVQHTSSGQGLSSHPESKIHFIRPLFVSVSTALQGIVIASLKSLKVSRHERNVFYVLTTINAP